MTLINDEKPLVSVIMPTSNQAAFIAEAVKSVIDQTYTNLELIIVDNFSMDNTKDIVQSFTDKRINYYQYNNSGVIAKGRNYGVSKSKGSILAFLDSDDIWLKEKLIIQLDHINIKGISCVASDYIPVGDTLYARKHWIGGRNKAVRDYSYLDIVLLNNIHTSSLITKRSYFTDESGFDETEDFKFIEDWDMWLRLSRIGKIRIMIQPLIKYRSTKVKQRDIRKLQFKSLTLLEKQHRLGYLNGRLLKNAQGNCYVNIGKACLDVNDKKGIVFYCKALVFCKGMHNRLRSFIGLFLFLLPFSVRRIIIELLYRINNIFIEKTQYFLSKVF